MSINDFKPNPDDITNIDDIDISEGCSPSNVNDAIRHVMSSLHNLINKTDVTQSTSGYMSATDKVKLDNINKATQLPKANGTAVIGTSTKYATEDHVHPITTTISGNAGTATKLQTARTITLAGDVTGSVTFDGSANVSITTTVTDDSHNHVVANIDGLQNTLNLKAPLASPALTGTPTAPTATANTNTTQIATTAFVKTALANTVTGPASSTNNTVVVFDGTTGKIIKDSTFTIAKSVPADAVFTDTTYTEATPSKSGLLSSADKQKLNSITASSLVGTKLVSLSNTRTATIEKNTDFTVPSYKVGSNVLMVFIDGVFCISGSDAAFYTYNEIGTAGTMSTAIRFHDDITKDRSIYVVVFSLGI